MTITTDDEAFARLLDALGPYLDRVVIAARMASGRALSPDVVLEVCQSGLKEIIGS